MTLPSISALIPHYGDPEPTLDLIQQLRGQEGVDLQIVVSDDNSPQPLPDGDGYTVVRRERNGGFGSNVNSAAGPATGDYIVVLNSDLTLEPSSLHDLLVAAAPHQPVVAGPKVVEDGRANYSARRWPLPRHHAWEWLTPLARFRDTTFWHRMVGHDAKAHAANTTTPTNWIMGACMLIPRAAFEQVGGFDERYFMNSEEVDIQRRLTSAGIPSIFLPQVTVEHAGGGSSPSDHRRGWVVDSRFQYETKWGHPRLLRALLTVATEINFLWNKTRELRGVPGVDAKATRTFERGLIDHGWRSRHGFTQLG